MVKGVEEDVVDGIVVSGGRHAGRNVVEVQGVANLPGDDVIGAGGVTAAAERTNELAVGGIEREATAEDIVGGFYEDLDSLQGYRNTFYT